MDTTIEAHGLVKRFGDTTAVAGDVAAQVAADLGPLGRVELTVTV
jgi:hypothetical protein